jgi:hypothetical protein
MMKNFLITQGCTGTYSLISSVGKYFNYGTYGTNSLFNHHSRNANNSAFTEGSMVVYLFCTIKIMLEIIQMS